MAPKLTLSVGFLLPPVFSIAVTENLVTGDSVRQVTPRIDMSKVLEIIF